MGGKSFYEGEGRNCPKRRDSKKKKDQAFYPVLRERQLSTSPQGGKKEKGEDKTAPDRPLFLRKGRGQLEKKETIPTIRGPVTK